MPALKRHIMFSPAYTKWKYWLLAEGSVADRVSTSWQPWALSEFPSFIDMMLLGYIYK